MSGAIHRLYTGRRRNEEAQGGLRTLSCKAGMYHYYGTARKNFIEYLQGENVKYKKYFYVLRPILACKWIEERRCHLGPVLGAYGSTLKR